MGKKVTVEVKTLVLLAVALASLSVAGYTVWHYSTLSLPTTTSPPTSCTANCTPPPPPPVFQHYANLTAMNFDSNTTMTLSFTLHNDSISFLQFSARYQFNSTYGGTWTEKLNVTTPQNSGLYLVHVAIACASCTYSGSQGAFSAFVRGNMYGFTVISDQKTFQFLGWPS